MGEKKEEKNATVSVKLPLTHAVGRSNTEYSCPHQISVSDLSARVMSLSQQKDDKKLKSSVSATCGEEKCLPYFSVDICFMSEHVTA